MRKKELFQSIKERGLLWSYDPKVKYGPELDSTVMKPFYGTEMLKIYGNSFVSTVKKRLKPIGPRPL